MHGQLLARTLRGVQDPGDSLDASVLPITVREAAFVEAADCFAALIARPEVTPYTPSGQFLPLIMSWHTLYAYWLGLPWAIAICIHTVGCVLWLLCCKCSLQVLLAAYNQPWFSADVDPDELTHVTACCNMHGGCSCSCLCPTAASLCPSTPRAKWHVS